MRHFGNHRFANGNLVVSCCGRTAMARTIKGFGVDRFWCRHCGKEARKFTSPFYSPPLTEEFKLQLCSHFWIIIK